MDEGDDLVAVVRGVGNSGIAVTLLDGSRQYTLLPKSADRRQPIHVNKTQIEIKQRCTASNTGCERNVGVVHCDSSAQATDGHYASMYKMTHCNLTPTSPSVQLTEFPPQRAELCRGHGNFEVGGCGSGESHSPTRQINGLFKGGMSWPDRGSVCLSRPSHEPDAFVNSLRRYPSISPERSEIVEKLVNYSQSKNISSIGSKFYQTSIQTPPTRLPDASNNTDRSPRSPVRGQRTYEHELNVRTRLKVQESPVRDWKPKRDCECPDYNRSIFSKNYDVRYLREVSRRFKDNLRINSYSYNHTLCPVLKESYDRVLLASKNVPEQKNTKSVNMETQAAVQMISKEAETIPLIDPSRRTVPVPLFPTSSIAGHKTEGHKLSTKIKSVHTPFSPLDLNPNLRRLKSVQTCSSSIDLVKVKKLDDDRRSKSQNELRTNNNNNLENEVVNFLEEISLFSNLNGRDKILLHEELLKVFKINDCKHTSDKVNGSVTNISQSYSGSCKYCIGYSADDYIETLNNEIGPYESDSLDIIINDWISYITIKNKDYLGRLVEKKYIKHTIISKLKYFITNYEGNKLKSKIFDYLGELLLDGKNENKRAYLKTCIDVFLKKLFNKKSWNLNKNILNVKQYLKSTETELRKYIRNNLLQFFDTAHIRIATKCLKELEVEIADILIDCLDDLNRKTDFREEIISLLQKLDHLTYNQIVNLTDKLIENMKALSPEHKNIKRENVFIVLQNPNSAQQSKFNESTDLSGNDITEVDLEKNLDCYMNQLIPQIDDWLTDIGIHAEDRNFRQVVVNDLAGDIVDRHKYLELNPTSQDTDAEELEHLKYQIFKWINKLVGENNTSTIEHADDLMNRIKSIPVPLLTKPGKVPGNKLPTCCQVDTKSPQNQKLNDAQCDLKPKEPFQDNINLNQIPIYGSIGLDESKLLSSSRVKTPYRRHSIPYAYNPDPLSSNNKTGPYGLNSSNLPMFGHTEPGGSLIAAPPRHYYGPGNTLQSIFDGQNAGGSVKNSNNSSCCQNKELNYSKVTKLQHPSQPACCKESGTSSNTKQILNEIPEPGSFNQSHIGERCCPTPYHVLGPNLKYLDSILDKYIQEWIKKIPLEKTSNSVELEKMHNLLYTQIYKMMAIVKCNPEILDNSVLYQDLLEDQIDILFQDIPKTPEFKSKEHSLKVQLVEKIVEVDNEVKKLIFMSTYKQQLSDNIKNNMPGVNKIYNKNNRLLEFHDLRERESIAEDFMLYIYFKDDKPKAFFYKTRLDKALRKLVEDISSSQNLVINIDIAIDSILNALHNVPVPPEEQLTIEANIALLGQEIEQWLIDIPLVEPDGILQVNQKRKLRDELQKKIYLIESKNIENCAVERELKHEVLEALQKLPLGSDEHNNINFMVEELVNRLKNKHLNISRKKSVTFNNSIRYECFGRPVMHSTKHGNFSSDESHSVGGNNRSEFLYSSITNNDTNLVRQALPMKSPLLRVSTQSFNPPHYTIPSEEYHSFDVSKLSLAELAALQRQFMSSISQSPKLLNQSDQVLQGQEGPIAAPYPNIPYQSVYLPVDENVCGNISTGQQKIFQTQLSSNGLERLQQVPCGQGMTSRQQGLLTSKDVSNQPFCGSSNSHSSPGQPILLAPGIPNQSQLNMQPQAAHLMIPNARESIIQSLETSSTSCGQPRSAITPVCGSEPQDLQTSPFSLGQPVLPLAHSICGNQLQAPQSSSFAQQNPIDVNKNMLHTSQIAGPSRAISVQQTSHVPCGVQPGITILNEASSYSARGITQPSTGIVCVNNQGFLKTSEPINQATGTQTMNSQFSDNPLNLLTPEPQNQGTVPKTPKNKNRFVNKNTQDEAKRKIECEENDEDDEEECNCMEKVWKCRRRRPMYYPCDDYDDYPTFYPMRYPFPYFF